MKLGFLKKKKKLREKIKIREKDKNYIIRNLLNAWSHLYNCELSYNENNLSSSIIQDIMINIDKLIDELRVNNYE